MLHIEKSKSGTKLPKSRVRHSRQNRVNRRGFGQRRPVRQLDQGVFQGFNFWKLIEGAERGKDAQGTIKILMDTDSTSYLTHFLHNIVGAQLNFGGAQALLKRYTVTPMEFAYSLTTRKYAYFLGIFHTP